MATAVRVAMPEGNNGMSPMMQMTAMEMTARPIVSAAR